MKKRAAKCCLNPNPKTNPDLNPKTIRIQSESNSNPTRDARARAVGTNRKRKRTVGGGKKQVLRIYLLTNCKYFKIPLNNLQIRSIIAITEAMAASGAEETGCGAGDLGRADKKSPPRGAGGRVRGAFPRQRPRSGKRLTRGEGPGERKGMGKGAAHGPGKQGICPGLCGGESAQQPPISRVMTAFCACRRFSASSKISPACASNTFSVISSPLCAGRQCCTIASGLARAMISSLT